MKKTEIEEKIHELSLEQPWNHQYHLPHGISTRKDDINSPGYNINKWKRLLEIFSKIIDDKINTCIDVGCSDGYYCIEAAKLFVNTQFTGLDLDPLRIERAKFIKKVLGIPNAEFVHEDLYNLIEKNSKFDLVMGLGLLHRVPDLDRCLKDLSEISNQYLILEFKSLNSELPKFIDHGGVTKSNSLNGLYKTPTVSYVEEKLLCEGFRTIHVSKDDSNLKFPRTIVVGEKNE